MINNSIDMQFEEQLQLNNSFFHACLNCDLKEIKQMLLSSTSRKPEINAVYPYSILEGACMMGNLEIIRFLLTSKELEERLDMSSNGNSALITAILSNKIEVIDYLLFSKELKTHANLEVAINNSNIILKLLYAQIKEKNEIINYLTYDYVKKTKKLSVYEEFLRLKGIKPQIEKTVINNLVSLVKESLNKQNLSVYDKSLRKILSTYDSEIYNKLLLNDRLNNVLESKSLIKNLRTKL